MNSRSGSVSRAIAFAVALSALALSGCETLTLGGLSTGMVPGVPKDALTIGKENFRAENYGLAEENFRKAVEERPDDAEGWIGLAASYDKLRRFDLADKAYAQTQRLTGSTPEFLNNRGYSYLLRGDVARARQDLEAAAVRDPGNERIRNNLKSLGAVPARSKTAGARRV